MTRLRVRNRLAVLVALACLSLLPANGSAQSAPAVSLRVMTFNLRYASDERPNSWAERRPVMRKVILDQSPDVIGTQEGLYPQLKDLARDLPAYDWIGLGREGGSRGEFMAVFYRRDRFEPMAFDHFWLSDTPNLVGSSTWGNENRRMVTWVRFRDRQSRREFFVWNTHLDHEIETARQKAAALIRERIVQADPAIPLLLVGDFNCAAGASKAFEILTGDGLMADAWRLAERRINDGVNSFNGFRTEARRQGVRIDWILLRGKGAQVARAEIVTYADKGQFPSDHFPVVADIRFEEQS